MKNWNIIQIKKFFILSIFIVYFLLSFNFCKNFYKDISKNSDLSLFKMQNLRIDNNVESELENNIKNQLEDIDFNNFENLLNDLDFHGKNLISNKSFLSIVKNFIGGTNTDLYSNFFSYMLSVVFDDIVYFLPYFATIIAIVICCSLIFHLSTQNNKSISNLLHIVCFSTVAVIVLKMLIDLVSNITLTISNIEIQMEVVFPVILTLITAIGNVITASSFQPLLAILSAIISKLFTAILIPIFICTIIFNVVGNISNNTKMEKFAKFSNSLFNWIIGIVFTIFIAFLALQGLTVSSIDSISIKTAKYAIKSYVPILGSYLSDGISLILASSVLIKNAIGATGLLLLFVTIFLPMIKVLIFMLLLKLTSAILEPLSDNKISNFLFSISKSLNMLNICLLAIGFMYLISVSILMCCSNIL